VSENPNPTRCGACGTVNPPGAEVCATCGAPLTITADPDALAGTPEALDNPAQYDADVAESTPGTILVGGMGGAPHVMPLPVVPERERRD
jgi:hypothetical protein